MNLDTGTLLAALGGAGGIISIITLSVTTWRARREAADVRGRRDDEFTDLDKQRLWKRVEALEAENTRIIEVHNLVERELRQELAMVRERLTAAEGLAGTAVREREGSEKLYVDLHEAYTRITAAYDELQLKHLEVIQENARLRVRFGVPPVS